MQFQTHRAVAALSPRHALRLCQSSIPSARSQREATHYTVSRLLQVEVESRPRVAVRTSHVTLKAWKNIIISSNPTSCNIHTGDPTPITKPTSLSEQIYHEMADLYFEAILEEVEELQNNGSDIIMEYSVRLFSHSLYLSLLTEGPFCPLSLSRRIFPYLLL